MEGRLASQNGSLLASGGEAQATSSVVHMRQDSEQEMHALFEALVNPAKQRSVPMKDRDLPSSFFRPQSTNAMASNSNSGNTVSLSSAQHSRDNSMDSNMQQQQQDIGSAVELRGVHGHGAHVGHSRSVSLPAQSLYGTQSARVGELPMATQQGSLDVGDRALGPGWEEALKREGKANYINHMLGETNWNNPGQEHDSRGRGGSFHQPQQQATPFFTPTQDARALSDIVHSHQFSAPHMHTSYPNSGETRARAASMLDPRGVAAGQSMAVNQKLLQQKRLEDAKRLEEVQQQQQQQRQRGVQRMRQSTSPGLGAFMGSPSNQSWQYSSGVASPGTSGGNVMTAHMRDASGDSAYGLQDMSLGGGLSAAAQGQHDLHPGYVPGGGGGGSLQGRMQQQQQQLQQSVYQPGEIPSGGGAAAGLSQAQHHAQHHAQQQQQQPFMSSQIGGAVSQNRFAGSGYSSPSNMQDSLVSGMGGSADQTSAAAMQMDMGAGVGAAGSLQPMMIDATLDSNRFNVGYGQSQLGQMPTETAMMPHHGATYL